jgi:cytochrome c peroxidase
MSKFINVRTAIIASCALAVLTAPRTPVATATGVEPEPLVFINNHGLLQTRNVNGRLDLDNPFFQDLGTNGRRCVTCHQPAEAWSITPEGVRERFRRSGGTDPIFRTNDGSNCEGAMPTSESARRAAYGLLLARAVFRIGLDVPANADFAIDQVEDPYHCEPGTNDISAYRRPLPTTNLRFLTAVMWDGRESSPATSMREDLLHQANGATRGHAAAAGDITPDEATRIVDFELGLFTAQALDWRAGGLGARGARGGPRRLSGQTFFVGINDPVGFNPTGAAFDQVVFRLFGAWGGLQHQAAGSINNARRDIARGERLFNEKLFTISDVAGLNGETFSNGVTLPDSFEGTCTVCHDTPNVGNHSVKAPLNIGISDPEIAPYLPVYTLRNLATGDTVRTTDPGRAMVTGRWNDVGKFKGPILRGLAGRAPYFHNGSARTLEEAVTFYERRFDIGLTRQEQAELAAFLGSL